MTLNEVTAKLASFQGERTALPYEGYSAAELNVIEALVNTMTEQDNTIYTTLYNNIINTISETNQGLVNNVSEALSSLSRDNAETITQALQNAVDELEYRRIRDLSFILSVLQAGKKSDQKYLEKYTKWCEQYDQEHNKTTEQ